METAGMLSPGFVTADAGDPTALIYRPSRMEFRFNDHTGDVITIRCNEVCAFKLEHIKHALLPGEKPDGECYVVEGSNWIKEHLEQHGIEQTWELRHFRFNFNIGVTIEAICKEFNWTSSPDKPVTAQDSLAYQQRLTTSV